MKKSTFNTAAFSLMDLPSDERMKWEDQIMERALALWSRKQSHRLSPFNALRRGEKQVVKSK